MSDHLLSGVFPVIPAIFDDTGAVDYEGFDNVVNYALDAGAHGVVFPGLASEVNYLTEEERVSLTKRLSKLVEGRAVFIVGASSNDPKAAVTYAKAGAEVGAKAAMIITPSTLGEDVDALIGFYKEVSDSSGLAIMMQNAPKPMGLGLDVKTLVKISDAVENIKYVKEETQPCGQRITGLQKILKGEIDGVFGGAGGRYLLDELNRGAVGTLPACEITEVHVQMYEAFQEGRMEDAYRLYEESLPLLMIQAVFRWRLTKEVLRRRGLIKSAYTRAPGAELDELDLIEVTKWMERAGVKSVI